MSKSKTISIKVNDILDELKDENNRLYKQLLIADKCNQLLIKFKDNSTDFNNCCKCEENIKNKVISNHLLNEYKCVSNELNRVCLKTNDKTSDKAINNLIKVCNNKSVYKPKVSPDSDQHLDPINDSEDKDYNQRVDENESQSYAKTIKEENNESIDNTMYINSDCDSAFSVVRKRTKNSWNVERVVCNFNGCEFECMSKNKMQRHIQCYHSNHKTPITCEECKQIVWTRKQLTNHIKRVHKELFDKSTQKFICTFSGCYLQFKKSSSLALHKRRHTGDKHFKCSVDFPECEWSFFTPGELRNHQIGVHSTREFYCDWIGCGEGFKIKTDLELHKLHKHCESVSNLELFQTLNDEFNNSVPNQTYLKEGFTSNYSVTKHMKSNRITHYICNYNYCDFKCSVKDKMETHVINIHLKTTPINCVECIEMVWTQKQLTNHIRLNHSQLYDTTTQLFKCNYKDCNLSFDRLSKLLLHRKRHFGQKSFKCSDEFPNCIWSFFTLGELRNHQKWSHSDDYPYVCDWNGCEKRFKLKNLLADHKLTHTGDMPYPCEWPGCDMKFVRQTSRKVHMTSHIGLKPYVCDWPECGHAFRTNSNLRTHYSIHTNVKPFACEWPGCDSRFISSSSLTRHKLVHKNEGQFLCCWPQCTKKFKSKFSLKIHIMAHKGEKPFRCEAKDCDMRFVEKKQMKKHFRRRHLPKI